VYFSPLPAAAPVRGIVRSARRSRRCEEHGDAQPEDRAFRHVSARGARTAGKGIAEAAKTAGKKIAEGAGQSGEAPRPPGSSPRNGTVLDASSDFYHALAPVFRATDAGEIEIVSSALTLLEVLVASSSVTTPRTPR
jgi:hypothetical protein